MAAGITRGLNFKSVTYKFQNGGQDTEIVLPATLSDANTLWNDATKSKPIVVRSDHDVLLNAVPDSGNNITWRESGKGAEQYTDDITAAPSSPPTFDLELSAAVDAESVGPSTFTATTGGATNIMEALLQSNANGTPALVGTYALLMVNILQKEGKGTGKGTLGVGPSGTNEPDQGLFFIQSIKHNGLEPNVRTSDVVFFTLRAAQFLKAKVFNYGPS